MEATTTEEMGVLAVLPRGETYRNFVYGGALGRLHKRVGVGTLAVIPNDEARNLLESELGFVDELKEIDDDWSVEILRELIDLAHCRWMWSKAAQDRWYRREADVASPSKRRKWRIKKAIAARFASRGGIQTLSKLERRLSRKRLREDHYLGLLRKLKPAVAFNASHVHSRISMQAIQAAQWLGIHTSTFVFSWDNLTSQGRILLPYDSFMVWNEALKADLLGMYKTISPEQVHVTGTPQFDAHFRAENDMGSEAFRKAMGADPDRPLVLYTTGMPNHMPGEPELVEQIAEFLSRIETPRGTPQLLLRVYPKDRTGRFEPLRKRRPDILFQQVPWDETWLTPLPEDARLLASTLKHVDLGINVASTVSLELCMFDKPVINVAYDPPGGAAKILPYARYYEFDHYKKVVDSGAVRLVRSPLEMEVALQEELSKPGTRAPERKRFIEEMFGDTLDGHSGDRIADLLADIAAQERAR